MRLAALLLLASLFSPLAHAKSFENADAAIALTEQVMKQVAAGDLKSAFETAKPYTVVPASEVDAMLTQAESQQPLLLSRFGKSLGYERVRTDTAGTSFVRVIYIQRFERHVVVWRFVLYRGADGWVINSFKYSDDLSDLFKS